MLGWLVAIGFAIGAILSGVAGFIGNETSRCAANVRTSAGRDQLARLAALNSPSRPGPSPACSSQAWRSSASTVYYWVLTGSMGLATNSRTVIDALVALGFGASLISILCPSRRRHLHQGCRRRRRFSSARWRPAIPEDDPRKPGDHRRQRRRQRRRLRRHGSRPVRDLRGGPRSPPWGLPRSSSRAPSISCR